MNTLSNDSPVPDKPKFETESIADYIIMYTTSDGKPIRSIRKNFWNGLKEAGILSRKFYGGIGTLHFKNDLTSIGPRMFMGCENLAMITIPKSVKFINEFAFAGCSSLEGMSIPHGVGEIGDHAFYGCRSMKNVSIPDSVWRIHDYAFSRCESIESIALTDSFLSFGIGVFESCFALSSVKLGKGIMSISEKMFNRCTSLRSISIPETVNQIGDCAFEDCSSLEHVDIPPSVTKIDMYAFSGCTSLDSVIIPGPVSKIDTCAFFGCSKLRIAVLSNSVTSIGESAFANCGMLETILLPENISNIGHGAFWGCEAIMDRIAESGRYYKIFAPGLICNGDRFSHTAVNDSDRSRVGVSPKYKGFYCYDNPLSAFEDLSGCDGKDVVLYEVESNGYIMRSNPGIDNHVYESNEIALVRRIHFSDIRDIIAESSGGISCGFLDENIL